MVYRIRQRHVSRGDLPLAEGHVFGVKHLLGQLRDLRLFSQRRHRRPNLQAGSGTVRARYCCDPREVSGAKPVMKKCKPGDCLSEVFGRVVFGAELQKAQTDIVSTSAFQDTRERHQVDGNLAQVTVQPYSPATRRKAGFPAQSQPLNCKNQQTRLELQSPAAVPGSASSRSRRSWPQRPSGSGHRRLASSASSAARSEMFFRTTRLTMPTTVPSPAGLQLSSHLSRDRRYDMRTAGKSKQGSRCRLWNLFRSDKARLTS